MIDHDHDDDEEFKSHHDIDYYWNYSKQMIFKGGDDQQTSRE